MDFKLVLLSCLLGYTHCILRCDNMDTVVNKWEGGRSGYVVVPAKAKDLVVFTFSGELVKPEFYCMELVDQYKNSFTFVPREWCPSANSGLKLEYALYYKSSQPSDRVHITQIEVNGRTFCNGERTNNQSGENGPDCSKNVKVNKNIPGGQDGTISMTTTRALYQWKVVVGFDRDVTGFNINEAQPDTSKDPCPKINTHQCYLFNANLTAGTFNMKYYLSFEESKGVPSIVYVNLYDNANSYNCGTKPQCP